MKRLLFDIEADGLLPEVTKVHCIAAVDVDTRQRFAWGPQEIDAALATIETADIAIAHFGLEYDFPALKKVKGFKFPKARQRDTVVMARLIRPDLRDTDSGLVLAGRLPGEFHGSHKLAAWGHRLGEHKAHFEGPWDVWTPEMQDYCVQDISTNLALWDHLKPDSFSQIAIELEHRIALLCMEMEAAGWPFDIEAAGRLHSVLVEEKERLTHELKADFGFWYAPKGAKRRDKSGVYADAIFTPKRPNPKLGYDGEWIEEDDIPAFTSADTALAKRRCVFHGYPLTRLEKVAFNPSSRPHIFRVMQRLGWKPKVFTDNGKPKIDETTLTEAEEAVPQAKKLIRYLMLDKRLGQLAEGEQAWLKQVKPDGRMHGRYNPMGTITGRAAHFNPNLGQVPALKDRKGRVQPFGRECRELFCVPPGWKQIGADMTGLEIACLCHYLVPIPNSADYIHALREGDPHAYHQGVTGVTDRGKMKTWYYAYIYGAGDGKLASILELPFIKARDIRDTLEGTIPTGELVRRIRYNMRLAGNTITGLDGRTLPVRSEHSALNTLLQSAGAILCKQWVCDAFDALLALGLRHGWDGDFVFLGWIHDEVQVAVRDGLEEKVGALLTECAKKAGEPFGFRVPLASAYKIGRNWAECH